MIGTNVKTRPLEWGRVSPWALAAALVGTVDVVAWWLALRSGFYVVPQGLDFTTYTDAARSFLGGHGFYFDWQLAGPYGMAAQPILYPPTAIPLFAAFTVLPGFLWWAVPLGVLAAKVSRLRGSRLLAVLALLAWPQTIMLIMAGNPVMWMAAAVSLGLGPLVLLKPTLAPFALFGVRERRWWIALVGLALVSLAFLPLWADYATVLLNARDGQGWLYLFGNVPLMLVGALLWHGRAERNRERGQDRRRGGLLDGHVH